MTDEVKPAFPRASHSVERVSGLSPDEFHARYTAPRRPVVLTDIVPAWPAYAKWDWDFFSSRFGSSLVVPRTPTETVGTRRFSMGAFIDYIRSEPSDEAPLYVDNWHFEQQHPELARDYCDPFFCEDWLRLIPRRVRPDFRWIYLGPPNTGSVLHVDTIGTHAWLAQIIGRKRWLLFPPQEIPEEYCKNADAFSPDFARYPAFAAAVPFDTVLEPGEMIFVPSGWRHQVRNLDATLAVTGNYVDAANFLDAWRSIAVDGPHAHLLPLLERLAAHKAAVAVDRPKDPAFLLGRLELSWLATGLEAVLAAERRRLQVMAELKERMVARIGT